MARSALQNTAYLYLVLEREFLQAGKDVVKAGRTANLVQRMSQYPKASVALAAFPVARDDADVAEAALLGALRKRFKERRDLGLEYFEGVIPAMVALAAQVAGGFTGAVQRAARAGDMGEEVPAGDVKVGGVTGDVDGVVGDVDGVTGEAAGVDGGDGGVEEAAGVDGGVEGAAGVDGDVEEGAVGIQVDGLMDPFLAVSAILDASREVLSGCIVRAADFYKEALAAGLARVTYSKFVDLLQRHGVREGPHPFPEGSAAAFSFPRLVPEEAPEEVDPWVETALEFIEAHINFSPVRTEAGKGRTYYAYISEKELVRRFQGWYRPRKQRGERLGEWKGALRRVMEGKGRVCVTIRPTVEGRTQELRVYHPVAWRVGSAGA